jgi:hypothetical protein
MICEALRMMTEPMNKNLFNVRTQAQLKSLPCSSSLAHSWVLSLWLKFLLHLSLWIEALKFPRLKIAVIITIIRLGVNLYWEVTMCQPLKLVIYIPYLKQCSQQLCETGAWYSHFTHEETKHTLISSCGHLPDGC